MSCERVQLQFRWLIRLRWVALIGQLSTYAKVI
jgi:hypothetical protein